MPEKCIVCQKVGGHRLPTDPDLLEKWREALALVNTHTGQMWTPRRKAQVVCRDHFLPSDFMPIGKKGTGKHRRLQPWAVPSVFTKAHSSTSRRRKTIRPFSQTPSTSQGQDKDNAGTRQQSDDGGHVENSLPCNTLSQDECKADTSKQIAVQDDIAHADNEDIDNTISNPGFELAPHSIIQFKAGPRQQHKEQSDRGHVESGSVMMDVDDSRSNSGSGVASLTFDKEIEQYGDDEHKSLYDPTDSKFEAKLLKELIEHQNTEGGGKSLTEVKDKKEYTMDTEDSIDAASAQDQDGSMSHGQLTGSSYAPLTDSCPDSPGRLVIDTDSEASLPHEPIVKKDGADLKKETDTQSFRKHHSNQGVKPPPNVRKKKRSVHSSHPRSLLSENKKIPELVYKCTGCKGRFPCLSDLQVHLTYCQNSETTDANNNVPPKMQYKPIAPKLPIVNSTEMYIPVMVHRMVNGRLEEVKPPRKPNTPSQLVMTSWQPVLTRGKAVGESHGNKVMAQSIPFIKTQSPVDNAGSTCNMQNSTSVLHTTGMKAQSKTQISSTIGNIGSFSTKRTYAENRNSHTTSQPKPQKDNAFRKKNPNLEKYVSTMLNQHVYDDYEAINILGHMLDRSIKLQSEVLYVKDGQIQFPKDDEETAGETRLVMGSPCTETKEKVKANDSVEFTENKCINLVASGKKSRRKSSRPQKVTQQDGVSDKSAKSYLRTMLAYGGNGNQEDLKTENTTLSRTGSQLQEQSNTLKVKQGQDEISKTLSHNIMVVGNTVVVTTNPQDGEGESPQVTMVDLEDDDVIGEDQEFHQVKGLLKDMLKKRGRKIEMTEDTGNEAMVPTEKALDGIVSDCQSSDLYIYCKEIDAENETNSSIRGEPVPTQTEKSARSNHENTQIVESVSKRSSKNKVLQSKNSVLNVHSAQQDRPVALFSCGICSSKFVTAQECITHVKREHVVK